MDKYNLQTSFDSQGRIQTSDEDLNRIIRAVEADTGAIMGAVVPAVTFDDNPDEKVYLLLMTLYGEYDTKDWQIKVGRQTTYDFLRDLVKNEVIDPNESFVLSGSDEYDPQFNKDNAKFEGKPITVFRFLKVMYESHKVLDENSDFDINEFDPVDYAHGDKTIME